MRKTLLTLLIVSIAVGVCVVSWASYAQHDNAYRVNRAQQLVREIQQLTIGKSKYHAAEAIARKFGNAPPPDGRDYYKENCAAREHIEECSFLISLNNSPIERVQLRHPSLPHLGSKDWWGYAEIHIANGTVLQYSFWVWYEASHGNWEDLHGGKVRLSQDTSQLTPTSQIPIPFNASTSKAKMASVFNHR